MAEVTLLEEHLSTLPCSVANGTASMNTCLEVRPRFAVQTRRRAAVSTRSGLGSEYLQLQQSFLDT